MRLRFIPAIKLPLILKPLKHHRLAARRDPYNAAKSPPCCTFGHVLSSPPEMREFL
jgi:hypothetical protein